MHTVVNNVAIVSFLGDVTIGKPLCYFVTCANVSFAHIGRASCLRAYGQQIKKKKESHDQTCSSHCMRSAPVVTLLIQPTRAVWHEIPAAVLVTFITRSLSFHRLGRKQIRPRSMFDRAWLYGILRRLIIIMVMTYVESSSPSLSTSDINGFISITTHWH